MTISEQLGSRANEMQIEKGEENAEGMRDGKDAQPTHCLNLEISKPFLTSIRLMLAWDTSAFLESKNNDRIRYEDLKTSMNQLTSVKNCKRIPIPTELPLFALTIGNKKVIRTGDCNILAYFGYATQQVVCLLCYKKLTRRVDIPFSDITSLIICFDYRGFDTLRIEVRSSLEYFSAGKPHPGKHTHWKVEDSKEDDSFPESKSVFLEIEKGLLEKGLAKLLYIDPKLQRTVKLARGASDDQYMYQGRGHARAQQINMCALQPLPSDSVFPYIGGRM